MVTCSTCMMLDKYIRSLIIDEIKKVFDIKNPILGDGKTIKSKK